METKSKAKKNRLHLLLAIALSYEKGQDKAPRVVAKGTGRQAQRIMDLAQSAGVPLHQDDDLAQVLKSVELETMIPPELYEAVARTLSFVYAVEKRAK